MGLIPLFQERPIVALHSLLVKWQLWCMEGNNVRKWQWQSICGFASWWYFLSANTVLRIALNQCYVCVCVCVCVFRMIQALVCPAFRVWFLLNSDSEAPSPEVTMYFPQEFGAQAYRMARLVSLPLEMERSAMHRFLTDEAAKQLRSLHQSP